MYLTHKLLARMDKDPKAEKIVLCITPILNMFNTAAEASTNVTSTTLLANWEKGFNRAVFNRDKKPA